MNLRIAARLGQSLFAGFVLMLCRPALAAAEAVASGEQEGPTIIVVRHAEKDPDGGDNPVLTPDGLNRATKLERLLRKSRTASVDFVYTTELVRTQLTAAFVLSGPEYDPNNLSVPKRPEPKRYHSGDITGLVADVYKKPPSSRNQVILIVHHSTKIPGLIAELTDKKDKAVTPIAECDYERIFILRRTKGRYRLDEETSYSKWKGL